MEPIIYHIEEFVIFEEVGFYTVCLDNTDESETDKFIERFSRDENKELKDDLDDIVNWIEQIGTRGLQICSLRNENDAKALPPNKSFIKELPYYEGSNLRLYCLPLHPQIIILFGGGIKSGQTVQDSPDLHSSFRLANKLAKKITEKITDGEIRNTGTELTGDFEIWF